MKSLVSLYLRIRSADGGWTYTRSVTASNGRLRPLYAVVDGKQVRCPEGVYHLRYSLKGKRIWKHVGSDASLAQVELENKNIELNKKKNELKRKAFQQKVAALEIAVPDATPLMPTAAPAPLPPPSVPPDHRRLLADCITSYLAETEIHKSAKTLAAYSATLLLFISAMRGKEIKDFTPKVMADISPKHIEDITRENVMAYVSYLRKRGNAPRTLRNRVDHFQIFLHHFGLSSLLKGKDLPKYTEKRVRAYNPQELGKMFGHATQDESDLLHWLLCTGTREQEAQYVCWSDVDLVAKTYTVTEHLDLGYRPKDKEEGTLPLPDVLIDILRARRRRYPRTRLIFPGKDGKPNGHALRIIKRIALRAGVNCGHCTNKAGQSCAEHAVCRHVLLHKMRKTYATQLHKNNVPVRTIQRYLRHSSLDVTLRYLADQDDDQTLEKVNSTFAAFGQVGDVA